MATGENPIRFVLDGDVHTVAGVSPTTTVLQYLREHLRRCGTKEGCAEGDCGACTVVLGELSGSSVRYRAINACIQFLPTLDGKALLTVESLKARSSSNGAEALHPVQRAMVESHGSQCGFCTPGFVMSLYALYRAAEAPDEETARQAISGNLCRCTGYRPILAAAQRMYEIAPAQRADELEQDRKLAARLHDIRVESTRTLIHESGFYIAPVTVVELLDVLADRPRATLLAGGTDVGLWATKQHAELRELVYLGNIAELRAISTGDSHLEIGAAVSLTDAFAALLAEYPDLGEVVRRFASPPICNAGTLVGNLANGSPIGDSMPALIALGASVTLRSRAGVRELPLEDLYLDYQKKDLRPGELVTAVRVPRPRAGLTLRSYKIAKRFEQDISSVCAAFAIVLEQDRVRSARIAFGGMAAVPKRAPACERALTGNPWNARTIARATQALAKDFRPLSDMRASAEYRARVAGNLLTRFHAEVSGRAATTVWSHAV
jgi:xanthine dehydrogenase small subunit